MDALRLHGMRFFTRVGHTEAERDTGHHLEVDLELALDLRDAGRTDDMERTVDYVLLHEALGEALEGARFHLLEAAAHTAANAVVEALREAGTAERVEEVVVRVRKHHPPVPGGFMDSASAEVTRTP